MKGIDIFCASPASTAVYSSIEQTARRSTKNHPNDQKRTQPRVPCSSHLPIIPKPYHESHRNSSASKEKYGNFPRRKSSADIYDLYIPGHASNSSRRCLLSDTDKPIIDQWLPESNHVSAIVPTSPIDSPATKKSPSSGRSLEQVVVLRVSMHCKCCERKVRKHISKMEGVKSFSTDLESKKVTIAGDVTPLGVLASVSKVKNARLWHSPTSSSHQSQTENMS